MLRTKPAASAHRWSAYPGPWGLPPHSRAFWQKKSPAPCYRGRAYTWRRPTLTGPVVPLPSALRRFTSGFGMGPGGSTALWPPEGNPVFPGLGLWLPEAAGRASRRFRFRLLLSGASAPPATGRPEDAGVSRPLPDIHTENFRFTDLTARTTRGHMPYSNSKKGIKPNG